MKTMKARVILCLRVTLLLGFCFCFFILLFPSMINSGLSYCKTFLKLKASELHFKFGPIWDVFLQSFIKSIRSGLSVLILRNFIWMQVVLSDFPSFHLTKNWSLLLRLFSFSHQPHSSVYHSPTFLNISFLPKF